MDLSQECFVKYTFPEVIDITLIDLDNIEGSGMFVDASGANKTFGTDQVLVVGQTITLTGCGFDPSSLTNGDFVLNRFSVNFKNVKNPIDIGDVSISIEMFAGIENNQALLKVAELQ